MKALSLTQPWAWLVLHGGKDIENRRWNTKLRGQFLIHAAKRMTRDEYAQVRWLLLPGLLGRRGNELSERMPGYEQLERGGIVGVAELFDVIPPFDAEITLLRRERWHMGAQYGFRLRNVRPLPFQPCPGALGFWRAPPSVQEALGPLWNTLAR